MGKAFVMCGMFCGFNDWHFQVIELCRKFYRKYDRYPDFIRMSEKTLDSLFDEEEKNFQDPYSEEHGVRDSKGERLIPLTVTADGTYKRPEILNESDENFIENYILTHTPEEEDNSWEDYGDSSEENQEKAPSETEPEEEEEYIYPMQFGPNDDCTVSFITNKFELKFLEGEDLPENWYIVQFGEDPDGGGEDSEEEEAEETLQQKRLAA